MRLYYIDGMQGIGSQGFAARLRILTEAHGQLSSLPYFMPTLTLPKPNAKKEASLETLLQDCIKEAEYWFDGMHHPKLKLPYNRQDFSIHHQTEMGHLCLSYARILFEHMDQGDLALDPLYRRFLKIAQEHLSYEEYLAFANLGQIHPQN